VNEQAGLASMHTIFVRYHNFIEEELHRLNPAMSGETLYQEARRLVSAVWQHTIYKEWLPVVMGPAAIRQYALNLESTGYYNGYDTTINAEIGNAFTTAAFRFAHSLIDNLFTFTSNTFSDVHTRYKEMSSVLLRPFELYNNNNPGGSGTDSIINGQISHPAQTVDQFFSDQVRNRLFSENPPMEPGTDLWALNLQRGRDHGLPGYLAWRRYCGLSSASNFSALADLSEFTKTKFQEMYSDVEDIDLWAGGISERLVPHGTVGPTFACIIGEQFRNLRAADRFWYEREDRTVGFNLAQLAEIRKISIARVICDTTDNINSIQPLVLLQPFSRALEILRQNNIHEIYSLSALYQGRSNERQDCSQLPTMDFSLFRNG